MALQLTARARALSERRNVTPNLILEIDGVPTMYSSIDTLKLARYGEDGILYGDVGLLYGGGIVNPNIKSYISIDGSGNSLRQQILQDKGAVSSVTSFQLELIDVNAEITNLISPGFVVTDLLTTKARVYINFKDGIHPDDSVLIHKGIIDVIEPGPASIKFTISSPEQQKRQELFPKATTKLNGAINAAVTTITVDSTAAFLSPSASVITSFIRIADELIQFTSKTDTQFLGCTRGSLSTTAASHADNDEIESFYRVQDSAINLALKLMLSGGSEYFAEDIDVETLGAFDVVDINPSIILFKINDVQARYGLVIGDKVTITGSLIGGNNQTDLVITGFGKNDIGSWVEISGSLDPELTSPAVAKFKSKYSILNHGMKMTPEDVDVQRHEDIATRFSGSIPDYDFYIKDSFKGDEFLSQEVYFPAGLFSIPRKAKASVGISVPPISDDEVVQLNEQNVYGPGSLKTQRSINKNFYNSVNYKYNELPLEEKFLTGKINLSADSVSRFPSIGNKPLNIISKGLRDSGATDVLTRLNSRRLLERYQFASESIPGVKVLFADAFTIEVGDVVVFGSPDLKITDLTLGTRDFQQKLYEVVNKNLNVKTGEATVDLLATNFELDGRYGVVSPSSYVGSGSTTTSIRIVDSFSTAAPNKEKAKWLSYVGEKILIHSPDWTYAEETTFNGISATDDYIMLVDALPTAPLSGYIVDIPAYPPGTDANENNRYKILHCFFDPQVEVTVSIDNVSFEVGAGDVAKFSVGSIIRVHNYAYTNDSTERIVTDITGTTITVDADLGYTPIAGDFVDLIGFPDQGLAYRIL